MKLRPFQEDAVNSIFTYFRAGNTGNPIVVAATGSGKSLIIGWFSKRAMTEFTGQRIIMATHVKELIAQNYEKLMMFWPDAPAGVYSAGLGKKQPWADIVCGGIQSMYKRAERFGHRDILLIDECHLLSPEDEGMYILFIEALKKINPHLKVIGFTATDWRTKGGSLVKKGSLFTHVIFKKGIKELVDEGFLSPLISKSSLIQADLTGIKMTAGEFNLKQAEAALDRDELTKQAIDEVEKLTLGRKHFLFFCAGVDHSLHVRDELRARGWLADVITCKTPSQERASLLLQFKHSKVRRALVNNAVLTTGTDLPNIDCIVLLRATMSSILYIQMLGRGMRLHLEKSNCLVLDYAGNIARFGAVDLIEAPYSTGKNTGESKVSAPPQRICPNCREPVQISKLECKCGYVFLTGERPGHENSASNQAIMSHEIKPVTYPVEVVTYKSHIGKTGIPCLRVMYYDKFGLIASDFIFFSHVGQPRWNAERWATDRGINGDLPKSTEEALAMSEWFKKPINITTIKSGQYQKILSYEFAN